MSKLKSSKPLTNKHAADFHNHLVYDKHGANSMDHVLSLNANQNSDPLRYNPHIEPPIFGQIIQKVEEKGAFLEKEWV